MNKIFQLYGKVAIVTGGAGMLGTEYCKTLAEAGAHIVIADVMTKQAQKLAAKLEKEYGKKMLAITTDLSNTENIKSMIKQVDEEFGKIDILVNNAAYNAPATDKGNNFVPFHDYPISAWQKSVDINLTGAFVCTQEAVKIMLREGIKGSIVNICSTYGIVAPDQSVYNTIKGPKGEQFVKPADYSATKSAMLNFTRYLAVYYGGNGIRVNTLSPGGVFVNNMDKGFVKNYEKRTPLGRMAKTNEYNGAMLFLASDASSYMTGANLVVDGGWTTW